MTFTRDSKIALLLLSRAPKFTPRHPFLDLFGDVCTFRHPDYIIELLDAKVFDFVLVLDEGIAEDVHSNILERLVAFVRNGGTAIIAQDFPRYCPAEKMDSFFR